MKRKFQRKKLGIWFVFLMLPLAVFINFSSAVAENVVVIPLVKNLISAVSPSDVVDLGTGSISSGADGVVVSITPKGSNDGVFTVPAGKYLVVTALSVFPQSPAAGSIKIQLIQNSASRKYWVLPNTQPSHLSFGPGILIDSGYSLKIHNVSSSGDIRVGLYGYVTDK